jgi:pSer/pThr/pTyr-binding forkhead associated (FHA) protein
MATLLHTRTGEGLRLHTRNVIGRSPAADLQLNVPEISNEHAVVWWSGDAWSIRDLASRNGTFVDGKRIPPGTDVAVHDNITLQFGDDENNKFTLTETSAPQASAVSLLHDTSIDATGEILALPTADNPQVTVYRDKLGHWVGESSRRVARLSDLQLLRVAGDVYRVYLPVPSTETVRRRPKPQIDTVKLRISHSVDEEYVSLEVVTRSEETLDLKARAHNYLLLLLARQRQADAEAGGSSAGHGWVYRDQLARQMRTDETTVNVQIFRARKALAEAGIDDAALVVESRVGNRQVRIGVTDVEIVTV